MPAVPANYVAAVKIKVALMKDHHELDQEIFFAGFITLIKS